MSPRILVVDDESAIREFIQEMLWLEGYQTQEAADGLQALQVVAQQRPDLVILDLLMPRMNGIELATRLRAQDPALPLLIISASHDGDSLAASLDRSEFIPKPFEMDTLLAALARLLEG